ncbi:hypothetical protein M405DRAFT_23060 [Rhizopogon salebrosus TDB-379]|nr:hypothetical protein M405DRAFT_23060 [Rhizopogon salebrosus TDB-379]
MIIFVCTPSFSSHTPSTTYPARRRTCTIPFAHHSLRISHPHSLSVGVSFIFYNRVIPESYTGCVVLVFHISNRLYTTHFCRIAYQSFAFSEIKVILLRLCSVVFVPAQFRAPPPTCTNSDPTCLDSFIHETPPRHLTAT